jgi:hypothetical protein
MADNISSFYLSNKALNSLEISVGCTLIGKESSFNAWKEIINCLFKLHSFRVLSNELIELEDFVDTEG